MTLTQEVRRSTAKGEGRDLAIPFGYALFAVLLMVGIYFAAGGPGVAPGDFATMGAFP